MEGDSLIRSEDQKAESVDMGSILIILLSVIEIRPVLTIGIQVKECISKERNVRECRSDRD